MRVLSLRLGWYALLPGLVAVLTAPAQGLPGREGPSVNWNKLTGAYAYDVHKKPVVKMIDKSDAKAYRVHIEFAGPDGDNVTGVYERPKQMRAYPCVLLLHGWTSSKDDMARWIGSAILDQGMSFLALDAPKHGERKAADGRLDFMQMWKPVTMEGIRDYRMAILWLADRKDVDLRHIGVFGYSMGAMMGAVFAGVDSRIQAAVLCVGGDLFQNPKASFPDSVRQSSASMSPSLYIGHISPRPVLMLNGKQDNIVSESASKALFSAAKDPKEQILFESGHILPTEGLVTGVKWLAKKLR